MFLFTVELSMFGSRCGLFVEPVAPPSLMIYILRVCARFERRNASRVEVYHGIVGGVQGRCHIICRVWRAFVVACLCCVVFERPVRAMTFV